MNEFDVKNACPACGYAGTGMDGAPFNKANRCMARATDVPLRCEHCADPAELAKWPQERYELDGKVYAPITRDIDVSYSEIETVRVPVSELPPGTNADEIPALAWPTKQVEVPKQRKERVIDENATIAAGPITPPRTIPHAHRTCIVCGTTWPELLKA